MSAVSDTSPINYLILIGEIHLLPALYGSVFIPPAVLEELRRTRTPEIVRSWIARSPLWFEVRAPRESQSGLAFLDPGERDAIILAEQIQADRVIIDERSARNEAVRRDLPVIGTIGVLRAGTTAGLVDLKSAIARLQKTTFRISQHLLDDLASGKL